MMTFIATAPLWAFLLAAMILMVRMMWLQRYHSRALKFVTTSVETWRTIHPITMEHAKVHGGNTDCWMGWMQFYNILNEPQFRFDTLTFVRWRAWTYQGCYGELEKRINTILMMETLTK